MKRAGLVRVMLLGVAWSLAAATTAAADAEIVVEGRAAMLRVPSALAAGTAAPLLIALHGYGMPAENLERWLDLPRLSREMGFLYVTPDGLTDCHDKRFWNATSACCNFCGSNVDDVAYLQALVDAVKARARVDPRRVYVIGFSNGGFMAHRLGCERAETFAAIVSFGGAGPIDASACRPSRPVHALVIHGTSDRVIHFNGGTTPGGRHPGALHSAERWAKANGCATTPDASSPPLDLVQDPPGAESSVLRYAAGCSAGGSAELWSVTGGVHVPRLAPDFGRRVMEYLLSQVKPAG